MEEQEPKNRYFELQIVRGTFAENDLVTVMSEGKEKRFSDVRYVKYVEERK